MARELSCPDCEFVIRSENEDEPFEFVQQHDQETHRTEMSADDIRGAWRTV